MNYNPPVSIFIFWSAKATALARLIIRVTGRQLPDKSDAFTHMGLCFKLADGDIVYYETLYSDGFSGPKPFRKLIEFHAGGGRLCIKPVYGVPSRAVGKIKDDCDFWVGRKGYYAWQLISMWSFERLGRYLGAKVPRSPGRWVCSEAVARLLWPHVDLRDPIHDRFDAVNPNSAYRRYLEIFPFASKRPTNGDPTLGAGITLPGGISPICNSIARDFDGNGQNSSPKTANIGENL